MSYLTFQFLFLFISHIQSCKWSPNQCGCSQVPPSVEQRIVGGTVAKPNSWPWIVSVRKYGGHTCGGVLITNRHVLSAAHCFPHYYPSDLSWYTFAMGHHKLWEENFVSKAKRITIHASYDINGRSIHDIALIELERTVNFTNSRMGFICLPLSHINDNGAYPPVGTKTWVVGWGATRYDGHAAQALMQVSVPITQNKGCQQQITESTKQICAGYDKGEKDSCQGDSGGPLVIEVGHNFYELVGLVSFGIGCADIMKPGIYTRVSGYIDWINDNINGNKPNASYNNQGAISSGSNYNQNPSQAGLNIMGALPQALMSGKGDYQKISHLFLLIEVFFLLLRNVY